MAAFAMPLSPVSTGVLRPALARDARDERDSFDAVAREHEAAVRAFALRLCRNSADASDLAQATFERALRRWGTFTPGTNARAWLFSILHNAFIDRCRRRATEPRAASIEDTEIAAPPPSERSVWSSITPEQVASAVATLDEGFRAVYRLHAEEQLSYQEIAAQLGLPVNTVGTRLARARRKLRALLEGVGAAEGDPR
jgi:RNA polymerase sigma-70 factor (ECF subfamily)